ncbi:MAG: hypothetical protein R3Y09_02415 [Clostridia bacterium]
MKNKKQLENSIMIYILRELLEKNMISRQEFYNLLEKMGEI